MIRKSHHLENCFRVKLFKRKILNHDFTELSIPVLDKSA